MTHEEYQELRRIFEDFCGAENRFDLLKIWHKNRAALIDCRLLIATSNGDDQFQLKKMFDHPTLKPLFAGESFMFLDRSSVGYHNSGQFQPISVDPCIVLDTNLVAKINGFISQNSDDKKTNGILEFVMGKPFYYGFYAAEEYENYLANRNHQQIKQKLKAICLFDHIDYEKYFAVNERRVEFQISEREAEDWAELKFSEMFSTASLPYLVNVKNAIYLLLLKTCEIEFRLGNNKSVKTGAKMHEIYEFMNSILKRLWGREVYLIAMYFEENTKLKNKGGSFFAPIQKSNRNLLHDLNGMAMDLNLLRTIERMPDASNQADIFLPYLVTRDERLNHVYDLLPKASKFFFYNKEKSSNFMSEWENQQVILNEMQSKDYWKEIAWFYSKTAQDKREVEQHENSQVKNLEFDANIRLC